MKVGINNININKIANKERKKEIKAVTTTGDTETGIRFKRHFTQASRPCNYMLTGRKTILKYVLKLSGTHKRPEGFRFLGLESFFFPVQVAR